MSARNAFLGCSLERAAKVDVREAEKAWRHYDDLLCQGMRVATSEDDPANFVSWRGQELEARKTEQEIDKKIIDDMVRGTERRTLCAALYSLGGAEARAIHAIDTSQKYMTEYKSPSSSEAHARRQRMTTRYVWDPSEEDQWWYRRPDMGCSQRKRHTEASEVHPWSERARNRAKEYNTDGTRKRVTPEDVAENKRARRQRGRQKRAEKRRRQQLGSVAGTKFCRRHGCLAFGRWLNRFLKYGPAMLGHEPLTCEAVSMLPTLHNEGCCK